MVLYILTSYQVLGIVYLDQLSGALRTHISYHDRWIKSVCCYPEFKNMGGSMKVISMSNSSKNQLNKCISLFLKKILRRIKIKVICQIPQLVKTGLAEPFAVLKKMLIND